MKTYYEVVSRYMRMTESGLLKPINDKDIVNAIDFGDAEKKTIDFLKDYVSEGEIVIKSIKKTKIVKVIDEDEGTFFKCRLVYSELDEKTEKIKKRNLFVLVNAENSLSVHKKLDKLNLTSNNDAISAFKQDFVIANIDETNISDIIEDGRDD